MNSAIAKTIAGPLAFLLTMVACVPNQAYRATNSTYKLHFPGDAHYFLNASAGLAFIEFDDTGKLFVPAQVAAAEGMIDYFNNLDAQTNGPRARGAIVMVFIHGWKNNASEKSGNVWGFRRALDEFSCIAYPRPVLGIFIGWPGVGFPGEDSGDLEDVSFSNRESVANKVGHGQLTDTLVRIMQKTKGPDYQGKSSCILVGHSFGGLVLETAITPVLKQRLDKIGPGESITSPADLIVLINEAAPARLAQPFLYYLHDHKVQYTDGSGKPYPLLLSMTSVGDTATKFAFPGGQFLSMNKPKDLKKFPQPDAFGLTSEETYYLLTTANTVALQNRQFTTRPGEALGDTPKGSYVSVGIGPRLVFDLVPKDGKNQTPYWVTQLPQIFVPDHGMVFGFEFMRLLSQLLCSSGLVCDVSKESLVQKPACTAPPPKPPATLAASSSPLPGASRIALRKQN